MVFLNKNQININAEALQQFLEVEYQISEHEKNYAMDNFHVKSEQLEQLEQALIQLTTVKEQTMEEA